MSQKNFTSIKEGENVLIRSSLNVPISDGKIQSTFRLEQSARTIKILSSMGVKTIVISHLGREGKSLEKVAEKLPVKNTFIPDILGDEARSVIQNMKNGDVVVLENLRQNIKETCCDKEFAKELSKYASHFVFDDFSVAHRNHSSVVLLPQLLTSYKGVRFKEEISALSRTINPSTSSLLVLGGAKTETKIPILEKFLSRYKKVFVGGVLLNALLKRAHFSVGLSKVGEKLPEKNIFADPKIISPVDLVVHSEKGVERVCSINDVQGDETVVDVGPSSVKNLIDGAKGADTIVWNGPLGWYEKGYQQQTKEFAEALLSVKSEVVIGGGDTVALISENDVADNVFLSTGGGAMLYYLLHETLPVVEALK